MSAATETAEGDKQRVVVDTPEGHERERVVELGRAVFPRLYRRSVQPTEHMLCARMDGEIVGGLIMVIPSEDPERTGIISWLFTAETARGRGVGSRLVGEGVSYLRERGCTQIVTDIEGHNTSSSNLFAAMGFERTTTTQLVRTSGVRDVLDIWWLLSYYVDFGHFLWRRPLDDGACQPEHKQDSEKPTLRQDTGNRLFPDGLRALSVSWVLNLFVLLLAFVGIAGLFEWTVTVTELVLLTVLGCAVFVVREAPLGVLAAADTERWTYRGCTNGIPVSATIGLLAGAFFPMLGSLYPASETSSYREKQQLFGFGAVISTSVLLITLLGVSLSGDSIILVGVSVESLVAFVVVPFLIVDHLLAFTPFQCYRGRRVYDWNRAVWGVLALVVLVTLGVVLGIR